MENTLQLTHRLVAPSRDAKVTQSGTIAGSASVVGEICQDWFNTVLCPGFFSAELLEGFKAEGFVTDTHDWTYGGTIAMPVSAEDRGKDLYCEAKFHSTPDAQNVRTKCVERMENNLAVGLSVGFRIARDGVAWFEKGEDLLAWANGKGFDMSLFNSTAILALEEPCRAAYKGEKLFEYAITPAPANPSAWATETNSIFDGRVSLESRLSALCDGSDEAIAELTRLIGLRSQAGRKPLARLTQAKEVAERLQSLSLSLLALDETAPEVTEAPDDTDLDLDAKAALVLAGMAS